MTETRPYFVVVTEPGAKPAVVDIFALAVHILRPYAEDVAYGWGNLAGMRVWVWNDDGKPERMALRCTESSPFDADGYSDRVWTATDAGGTEYARVSVRIDGRA
jgi:hypothetical protein